jgi:hypothetical protein
MTAPSDKGPERQIASTSDARTRSDSIRQPNAVGTLRQPMRGRRSRRNRMRGGGVPSLNVQPDLFGTAVPTDPLLGLAVKLPDTCSKCGDLVAIIGPGKPPHCASLLCQSCGLHRGWISRANYTFLNEVINKFGAPSEPIVFRIRSTKPEQSDDGVSVVQNGMKKENEDANHS